MEMTRAIAQILEQADADMSTEALRRLCENFGLMEINVANAEGIVIYSNFSEYIDFDYKSSEATKKYMALADGTINELQEEPRKSVSDAESIELFCHYTGIAREGGGFLQIGYDAGVILRLEWEINVEITIKETKLGETGYGIVLLDGIINAHPNEEMLGTDASAEYWYKDIYAGSGFVWLDIGGVKYYAGYKNENGYTVMGLFPEKEYNIELNRILRDTILFFLAALTVMTAVVYIIINQLLKPVKTVTDGLGKIAKGDFDARVEGNYTDEFALIKDAVNEMAVNLTSYLNDKLQAERLAHEAESSKIDLLVKVHHDALTSVYNRRYLDETFDHIVKSASRSGGVLSVLMVDIDCFKQFNDTYGHSKGDECLQIVARALSGSVTREDDFVVRYGGEEFTVILPNTDENGARQVADRIIENVRALNINNEKSIVIGYVTVSVGITTGEVSHTQTGDDYIKRADEALYMSKQNGRNRYTFLPMVH
jgi:diguanylate cyclase (GGDEF)-like protein